ncbi:MAG: type II toxin-antitoxin system HicA family toxin [Firmicutes bacterium]|nr:type II toxin-antitoxin system HicA family toxin [Bacillota bacterium]
MKTSELIKILKAEGCYLVRHGHNHDIWYSPITRKMIPLGRHSNKEVSKGTAEAILKDAGIVIDR